MKKLMLTASLTLSVAANAGGYIAAGLGIHPESIDCPEVCYGANTLARIRGGYEWGYGGGFFIAAEAIHISAPQLRERGRGMNAGFIDVIYRF